MEEKSYCCFRSITFILMGSSNLKQQLNLYFTFFFPMIFRISDVPVIFPVYTKRRSHKPLYKEQQHLRCTSRDLRYLSLVLKKTTYWFCYGFANYDGFPIYGFPGFLVYFPINNYCTCYLDNVYGN